MTLIEKKSLRKKKAIMQLVEAGEYSIAYAMMEAERLNDEGKLLDNDYEELAEWLEAKMEEAFTPKQEADEPEEEETEVIPEETEPVQSEESDDGFNPELTLDE